MKNLWEINSLYSILFHSFTALFVFKSYLCIENVFMAKLKHAECDYTFIYLLFIYLMMLLVAQTVWHKVLG
jgi:hypothetical protein